MRDRLKELRALSASIRGQSINMQHKLVIYWASMLAMAFCVILVILSAAGVLPGSAKKAGEMLEVQQQAAVSVVRRSSDVLMSRCIILSEEASKVLDNILISEGKPFEGMDDSPELIIRLETELFPHVKSVLDANICSGAFAAFDATVNTSLKNSQNSRMGVWLCVTDFKDVAGRQYVAYFRGAKEVARRAQMPMHNRWNLEFDSSELPGYRHLLSAGGRLAENCYWSGTVPLKGTWQKAMLCMAPVVDASGRNRGVCGVEITDQYFSRSTPVTESSAGNIITAVAPVDGDRLVMEQALLGDFKGRYMAPEGRLRIEKGKYFNVYGTDGDSYIGSHTVLPFKSVDGRPLAVCSLIPRYEYDRYASDGRRAWICGTAVVFLLLLSLSFYLSRRFVKPVLKSLKDIRSDGNYGSIHSGISEIDTLYAFLMDKRNKPDGALLPPDVSELLDTFAENVEKLTPMEKMVFHYYIDGFALDDIAKKAYVSINTVRKHNTNINRKLCTTNHEELLLYIDLFRRCGRLDRIMK